MVPIQVKTYLGILLVHIFLFPFSHIGVPIPDVSSSAQSSVSGGNPQAVLRAHPSSESLRLPQYREIPQQPLKTVHMVPPGIPPELNNWGIQPSDLSRPFNRQGTVNVTLPTREHIMLYRRISVSCLIQKFFRCI